MLEFHGAFTWHVILYFSNHLQIYKRILCLFSLSMTLRAQHVNLCSGLGRATAQGSESCASPQPGPPVALSVVTVFAASSPAGRSLPGLVLLVRYEDDMQPRVSVL